MEECWVPLQAGAAAGVLSQSGRRSLVVLHAFSPSRSQLRRRGWATACTDERPETCSAQSARRVQSIREGTPVSRREKSPETQRPESASPPSRTSPRARVWPLAPAGKIPCNRDESFRSRSSKHYRGGRIESSRD